jgi:hypothetical protein
VNIREWLRANDLRLVHPGHGHNEGDYPVSSGELDRLDSEFMVVKLHGVEA